MPAFSLPFPPVPLTSKPSTVNGTLFYHLASEILSFGILLESRLLSAQITLTSELLRFL